MKDKLTYFIMDRDEVIARGLRVHETQHSMKRRSPWHDYHGRGTYMLTLVVEGRMPLLGKLWGWVDARPGDGDAPKVILSELGIAIAKEEIPKIHKYYPQVEVWRVCIMPDHIHLIVRVKEDLRGGQAMESLGTEARGGTAWNGGERETDILFTTIKSLVEYEKILHQIAIYTLNSVKFKNILEFLC